MNGEILARWINIYPQGETEKFDVAFGRTLTELETELNASIISIMPVPVPNPSPYAFMTEFYVVLRRNAAPGNSQ